MFFNKERIDIVDIASSSLHKDYISSFSKLSGYYGGDYRSIADFNSLIQTNNIPAAQRLKLSSIIEKYNREFNFSEAVLSNIEKLKDNNCFTIITGQQPSLLTGPLYTIYKAISGIKLSEYLNNHFGGSYSFIPIFWVASEDHDLAEVNRLTHQSFSGDILSSSLNIEYSGETLDSLDIEKELSRFLDDFDFPKTEFSSSLLDLLSSSSKKTFSRHFVCLLSSFFKDKGLIIIEPYLFREMSTALNILSIDKREDLANCLRKTSISLEEANYSRQIDYNSILDNGDLGRWSMLFYLEGDKRRKIYYNGDVFRIANEMLSSEELFTKIETEPHNFSHSVVLRPIVQDMLFPNIATVVGPGELAYFAQLKGLYSIFGRAMPIIYPRISISIIEKKIARIKDRFSFSIEEIINNNIDNDKIEAILLKSEIRDSLEGFISQIKASLNSISSESEKQGRDIKESINPSIKKIEYELERLKQRFIKKCEDKEGISRKQIQRLKNALLPKMKLQERIFNIFSHLNLYGDNLIEEIMENTDIKDFSHQVLYYE